MPEPPIGADSERIQRARTIAQDVFRRRAAGEAISDQAVVDSYPELANELRQVFRAISTGVEAGVFSTSMCSRGSLTTTLVWAGIAASFLAVAAINTSRYFNSVDEPPPIQTAGNEPSSRGEAQEEVQEIEPKDAGNYIGQQRAVRGRVARVRKLERYAFIDFEGVERKTGLGVFIPGAAFKNLPEAFEDSYSGKTVRITGEIEEYQGHPSITIETGDQIEVLSSGEGPSNVERIESDAPEIIPADAAKHVGEVRTVRGRVDAVKKGDRFAFIYFEEGDRDSGFRVYVPRSMYKRLPEQFDEFYPGCEVRVTGEIESRGENLSISVRDEKQIVVVSKGEGGAESPDEPQDTEIVSVADAPGFVSQKVTVEGVVANVDRQERMAHIFFENAGDKGLFVYVPTSTYHELPDTFERSFPGKRVRVSGNVILRDGRPQIAVTRGRQIRVIGTPPQNEKSSTDVERAAGEETER